MKGIAHFATGLCAATFIPGVVEAASHGSLLIPLAGACAMLPDLLDFRFARFLQRRDGDVLVPASASTDSQQTADALARALVDEFSEAATGGCPRVIQLHPRRLGLIDWATWSVRFDGVNGMAEVRFREATAAFAAAHIDYAYDGVLEVGELGGPALLLTPANDGRVGVQFLPWHRTWSHSLLLALFCGAFAWACIDRTAGIVCALAFAVHVLEDQLGYMGSNLLWPLRPARAEERTRGMELLHSGDAIPNFVVVWTSLATMLYNFDRMSPWPQLEGVSFLGGAVVVPMLLLLARYGLRRSGLLRAVAAQAEALAETESG